MTEDSAQLPVASAVSADHMPPEHLRKEGWTMALYVSIYLIAALTALETVTAVPGHILGLVWGTTVGLALAHVFAFRIAGRLVHQGDLPKADRIVSMVQMVSAAAVALLSASQFCSPLQSANSTGPVTPVPALSVWSVTWSLAALHAAGYVQCCSASECSRLLSLSLRSNTR
jgi:hypothetical protein